ncbi:MAG TPA: DUF63 family protein [Candidatus Nanoarchaeia archaeon]|nr:DUF63 family protein [Candidatus Nanoarchaeia archaeon]
MTTTTPDNTSGFFEEFFVKPILDKTGYNPVNTVMYAILLVLGAYFLFRFLKKLGYKIDYRFLKATVPFIVLVSVWRALTDAGVYPYGFLTTTPGLYVPVLLLFFPLIVLAREFEKTKGWRYEYVYSGVSTALLVSQLIILITLLNRFNIGAFMTVVYFTVISAGVFVIIGRYWSVMRGLNLIMFVSHMFDASVTHVSLTYYNYFEQHVVPRFFFDLANSSLSFYPLKIVVLGLVIYYLDRDKKNIELTNFIKMIFIIYGLATGLRGLLRLSLGV